MCSTFHGFCALNRLASQCGARCARAGRGYRRPASDRQSARASEKPGAAKSESSSAPDSDPHRSPRNLDVRALTAEPWPSRRSPEHRCEPAGPIGCAVGFHEILTSIGVRGGVRCMTWRSKFCRKRYCVIRSASSTLWMVPTRLVGCSFELR